MKGGYPDRHVKPPTGLKDIYGLQTAAPFPMCDDDYCEVMQYHLLL